MSSEEDKDAIIAELRAELAELRAELAAEKAARIAAEAKLHERQVRWVRDALSGAIAETRSYHLTTLTCSCRVAARTS